MSLGARGGPARSGLPFADRGRLCAPSPPPARAPRPTAGPQRAVALRAAAPLGALLGAWLSRAGLPGPVRDLRGEANEAAVVVDAVRRAAAGTQ